jgi:hypothetical protein
MSSSNMLLNQTAEVMAENFAECFVDLRCLSLAAKRVAKLRLDHVKCGFDVAALVDIAA